VICDARGHVVDWHDGDTNLLGDLEPDSSNRHLLEVWPHWRSPMLDWSALIGQVLLQGTQVRVPDLKLSRGSGGEQSAVVDLIAYPVEFGDSRHAAIVLRDVTEQRQLERQARRTEAIEATVTFARGIAHDFSNLLTSAIASLSLAHSASQAARLRDRLGRALRACRQAAALSRRLLSYAGDDQGNPQVLCLRETVELILDSFDEEFFEGVRVRADWDGTVPVRIDRDQLTQIVLNLIRNAREAMPDGGDLHVKVETGRPPAHAEANGPPTHALLTVTDTGCGIAPEVKERLFEPFFTTKARGSRRSRGMGLAVVYAAAKNANGLIHVDSEPGAGTTFRVCLPLEEQPAAVMGEAPARSAESDD
jgi:signal transduction histidine kinase